MNVTVHAREGMEFYLTDKGAQISRIKVKYSGVEARHKAYRSVVPKGWIENGWVKEREIRNYGQQT